MIVIVTEDPSALAGIADGYAPPFEVSPNVADALLMLDDGLNDRHMLATKWNRVEELRDLLRNFAESDELNYILIHEDIGKTASIAEMLARHQQGRQDLGQDQGCRGENSRKPDGRQYLGRYRYG